MILPTVELNALSSGLSILAFLLLWLAIYLFRDIVLIAERIEKRGMGSGNILAALPLIMLHPLVTSYYYITTGQAAPADITIFLVVALFLASVLILKTILGFVRLSGLWSAPKAIMAIYLLAYPLAGLAYFYNFPPKYLITQVLHLAAEMMLGMGLIMLSRYTSDFKNLDVEIMGHKFSTHYNLSSLLMIAGITFPIDSTLRAVGFEAFLAGGPNGVATLQTLRLVSFALLTAITLNGVIGMYVFKRTVEDFCVRFGSMGALIGKGGAREKAAPAKRKKR
jgi:hypothetical protein